MAKLILCLFLVLLLVIIIRPSRQIFVLCGGGDLPEEVYDRFIELAGGDQARIVVIPSASDNPYRTANRWNNVIVLHAESRDQACSPNFCLPLAAATGVWFTGGDQKRLVELYEGTPVENAVRRVKVVGGTSAGASVVSNVMVYGDGEAKGFGLTDLVIDQHFGQRRRLSRLQKILSNRALTGVGIDEGTALVVDGGVGLVIGRGTVTVCRDNEVRVYCGGEKIDLTD